MHIYAYLINCGGRCCYITAIITTVFFVFAELANYLEVNQGWVRRSVEEDFMKFLHRGDIARHSTKLTTSSPKSKSHTPS